MNEKELQAENSRLKQQVLAMQEAVRTYRDLISRQVSLGAKFSAKHSISLSSANALNEAVQRIVDGKDSAGFRFVQGSVAQRV
jgi:hypothetical protein